VDVPRAVSTSARVNDNIIEMFKNNGINTYDYVDYRGNKVVITRNPFGFINEPEIKIGGSTTDADAEDED
jgi:hypothetical protein